MKKLILLLAFISISLGCDKDDYVSQNPYLPNYSFTVGIDLTLPLYSELNFTGNSARIFQDGAGINGIIVINTGSGFAAWEVTCPNQPITGCSILEIDGINAVCPCDEVAYSLFNGQGPAQYPLKQYRVEVITPTFIRVYN
jgi:hypothetical protein